MDRQIHSWYSHRLQKEMPLAMYGHYGFALLLIPTAAADFLEYERFQLIDRIAPFIDSGKVKFFSINRINTESRMKPKMHGRDKAVRQRQFNEYVFEELPLVHCLVAAVHMRVHPAFGIDAVDGKHFYLTRIDEGRD